MELKKSWCQKFFAKMCKRNRKRRLDFETCRKISISKALNWILRDWWKQPLSCYYHKNWRIHRYPHQHYQIVQQKNDTFKEMIPSGCCELVCGSGLSEKPDPAQWVTRLILRPNFFMTELTTAKLWSLFLFLILFVKKYIQPFRLKVSQYFWKLSNYGVYGNE